MTGLSLDEFERSELHQLAAAKCIEAIGEASNLILKHHPDFAATHPELELAQAYRTRNRLSHGYDAIDWSVVYATATAYVPGIIADARRLLKSTDVR